MFKVGDKVRVLPYFRNAEIAEMSGYIRTSPGKGERVYRVKAYDDYIHFVEGGTPFYIPESQIKAIEEPKKRFEIVHVIEARNADEALQAYATGGGTPTVRVI